MITKWGIPTLGAIMLLFATFSVVNAREPRTAVEPPRAAPQSTFASRVAAVGLVEPASELISVGTHLSGVVQAVFVGAGDDVDAGAPLFTVDDRDARAALGVAESRLAVANAKLAELRSYPRIEDIPPAEALVSAAEATVREAETDLANRKRQYGIVSDMLAKSAASKDEHDDSMTNVRLAEARLDAARARLGEATAALERLRAGTFGPLMENARAEVTSAAAQVEQARTTLERLTVRAPVKGRVLQVRVRVGEFAQAGLLTTPLMVLGVVDPLHVRVDVDETDASRVPVGAPAVAHPRGLAEVDIPLEFVRFEPYVVPKRSLSGDAGERTDTRVLQVIYRVKSDRRRGDSTRESDSDHAVFVGQQVDVFIESDGRRGLSLAAKGR